MFVKFILKTLNLILLINYIKCDELLTSSIVETTPALETLTLNLDINSFAIDNLSSTTSMPTAVTSFSSTTLLNDNKDTQSTSSWELIYPESNSTSTQTTATTSSTELSMLNTEASKVATNLPKYFKVDDVTNCQKYFGQCLRQVFPIILPKLKDGHQLLNIPPFDPIHFNSTAFQYNSNPFTGYVTIRYALIYGLTTMKFKKIDFQNLENNKFKARLSMLVPQMAAIGFYKGDLIVNNVRVRPKGDFNVSMTGLTLEMITLGTIYQNDGHKFLKFIKSNVSTSLKDSKITATGIVPDQRLNDIVVNVANQYWRDLFNIILPETRNNWSPILLDALNGALAMVPFDFLQ